MIGSPEPSCVPQVYVFGSVKSWDMPFCPITRLFGSICTYGAKRTPLLVMIRDRFSGVWFWNCASMYSPIFGRDSVLGFWSRAVNGSVGCSLFSFGLFLSVYSAPSNTINEANTIIIDIFNFIIKKCL